MAIKSPNTTPTTRPSTPDTMNSNKAQRTDEDRTGDSPESKKRSASESRSASTTVRRSNRNRSKELREREHDDVANTSHPSKKTKNDDVLAVANDANENVVTVTVTVTVSVSIPSRSLLLAKHSHSHSNVDEKGGFRNMAAIIDKVQNEAIDFFDAEERKRPHLSHFQLLCPTTRQIIMRLPPSSTKGVQKFRELNSFSCSLGRNALNWRLRIGRNFDGYAVERTDTLLFDEDVGFPNEEAKILGQQLASDFKAEILRLSHFTGIRLLQVGMDISVRNTLVTYKSDHRFFFSLTQEDCDQCNAMIGPVMNLGEDANRSSWSGSNVLRTTLTGLSVDMNDAAVAIVQSGALNAQRVFMLRGEPRALKKGRVTLGRQQHAGEREVAAGLTLLCDDPDERPKRAVSAVTKKLVSKELSKLSFIFKICITVKSIQEQRDCFVDMYNAVNKMDIASSVSCVLAELARRALVQFDEQPVSIAVLEFLYGKEVMHKKVAWLLGGNTENASTM